ncbi:outer membrane protein [Ponticoccus sp. (in: a-proteobacteria)]|uniref:outer membrane protein n=1 Tax=Ponticoccus sp. (in: a-proteobacteria) TaxID=1925025 RepID=UPI003AB223ED
MKSSILALAALATGLGSTAAFAGSLDQGYVEPVPVAPAPAPVAVVPDSDWTGGYVGLSYGNLDSQIGGSSDNGGIYGIHGGYDYDFGNVVLGGELEYLGTGDDYSVGGVDVDSMTRAKARLGYDFGNTLVYATAGAANIDTSAGSDTGAVGGVGLDYKVTDNFTIGGEALAHSFNDVGGSDLDAQTFSLRGAFRF